MVVSGTVLVSSKADTLNTRLLCKKISIDTVQHKKYQSEWSFIIILKAGVLFYFI